MTRTLQTTARALLSLAMLMAGCDGGGAPVDENSDIATHVDVAQTSSSMGTQSCTANGVSPELEALTGGPYQNCQGGPIPFISVQSNSQRFSGCCGDLLRTCMVSGYSTLNTMSCTDGSCTANGVSPQLAALPGGPYQNCQGGTFPRVEYQPGTQHFSGCCGALVRTCKVPGYSTLNTMTCM